MGNLCSCCLKNPDESQTNGHLAGQSGLTRSQRSLSTSEANDRTPLIDKSSSRHPHPLITPGNLSSHFNGDPSSIAPLPPPPLINETRAETNTKLPRDETAETKMAIIVEGMLSKLIDVGNGGSGMHSSNINSNGLNTSNDHLRQLLSKSFSSTAVSVLPDAGLNNLPSLLSGRPISSEICHYVAHTAEDLSRFMFEEIKITHKEELVVVFE